MQEEISQSILPEIGFSDKDIYDTADSLAVGAFLSGAGSFD